MVCWENTDMGITIEIAAGTRFDHRELPLTSEDALSAVRSLDGDKTTTVELENGNYLMLIGGGPDRFSISYVPDDPDGNSFTLVLNREARGTETHMLGGNWTDLPAFAWVCREAAEKAAVEFAETGRINLTPEWLDQEELGRLEHANSE